MRSALVLSTILTAASLVAGGAVAQQAPTNTAGLRYLSWPGKPPVAARSAPRPAVTQPEAPQPTVVAANRTIPGAIPLARLAPAPSAATPRSNGLTPASAWMGQAAPAPAQSAPAPYTPAPQPQAPEPVQSQPQAEAAPAPVPQQTVQAAPEPQPQFQPTEAAVADPMAPRRDAPIYRLQRPQAGVPLDGAAVAANQQAAQIAPTGDSSARYYSVHRQAGRHPDAIQAPQQTYLDALPVEMTQTPRSNDLAQPDGPPALIRNANGSLRAVPQTEADDLP